MSSRTCAFAHVDGAYVLGALGPAERTAFEAHLTACPACARAVARLAPMPGLLGRVDPESLDPATPWSMRLPQLLRRVATERRRRVRRHRWGLAAAAIATAVLAAAGTLIWSVAAGDPSSPADPAPSLAEMAPVGQFVPVTAQVAMVPGEEWTEVWMTCQYPSMGYDAPARAFTLVAVAPDGTVEELFGWEAAPGEEITWNGRSWSPEPHQLRLELRDATGAVLLARHPAGGSGP